MQRLITHVWQPLLCSLLLSGEVLFTVVVPNIIYSECMYLLTYIPFNL